MLTNPDEEISVRMSRRERDELMLIYNSAQAVVAGMKAYFCGDRIQLLREILVRNDRLAQECHGYDLDGKPLAIAACEQLVQAYRSGKARGDHIDWSDVDAAYATARAALGLPELENESPLGNFVLDGKPIDIVEFLQDNEELDQVQRALIGTLQVGESMNLGGGSAPIFVLGREPDDEPREPDPGSNDPNCIHEWAYTGEAYGGDQPGEGRCYCVKCGADGDA